MLLATDVVEFVRYAVGLKAYAGSWFDEQFPYGQPTANAFTARLNFRGLHSSQDCLFVLRLRYAAWSIPLSGSKGYLFSRQLFSVSTRFLSRVTMHRLYEFMC